MNSCCSRQLYQEDNYLKRQLYRDTTVFDNTHAHTAYSTYARCIQIYKIIIIINYGGCVWAIFVTQSIISHPKFIIMESIFNEMKDVHCETNILDDNCHINNQYINQETKMWKCYRGMVYLAIMGFRASNVVEQCIHVQSSYFGEDLYEKYVVPGLDSITENWNHLDKRFCHTNLLAMNVDVADSVLQCSRIKMMFKDLYNLEKMILSLGRVMYITIEKKSQLRELASIELNFEDGQILLYGVCHHLQILTRLFKNMLNAKIDWGEEDDDDDDEDDDEDDEDDEDDDEDEIDRKRKRKRKRKREQEREQERRRQRKRDMSSLAEEGVYEDVEKFNFFNEDYADFDETWEFSVK